MGQAGYEYKLFRGCTATIGHVQDAEADLGRLGHEGWRVVAVPLPSRGEGYFILLLERQIQTETECDDNPWGPNEHPKTTRAKTEADFLREAQLRAKLRHEADEWLGTLPQDDRLVPSTPQGLASRTHANPGSR